jgi:competence protein ComEC
MGYGDPFTDIWILNVGKGSCAVIDHPSGRRTMVDINNGQSLADEERSLVLAESAGALKLASTQQALTNPVQWYADRFGTDLWRFILSHPDNDHMSGLRCLLLEEQIRATVFWDLAHHREKSEEEFGTNKKGWHDWLSYNAMRMQLDGYTWPQLLNLTQGEVAHFWDEDQIEILSPSAPFLTTCDQAGDWNNMSFVLRFMYAGRTVIIPGDVGQDGWDRMAGDHDMSCDVLVASHHGRRSGYPDNGVLDLMAPEAVIISTARIAVEHDATRRYKSHVRNVLATRQEGNVKIRLWANAKVWIEDQHGNLLTAF